MCKRFVLTASAVALLGLSASALADDDDHDRHKRHHYGGHHGPPYGYGPPRHRGYGRHYGRKHYHDDDDFSDGVKIAAGAVVLGTIIYAISQNQKQQTGPAAQPAPPPPPTLWYRIDGNGDCVEVRLNSRGQEVWTYVDPSYCQ